jgi:hypothetical protein
MSTITNPTYFVEQRPGRTYGKFVPNLSQENLCRELELTGLLNAEAKTRGWKSTVLDVLIDYTPIENLTRQEIKDVFTEFNTTVYEARLRDWRAVSKYVVDDECADLFNLMHKYLRRKKVQQKYFTRGVFIEKSGIGYLQKYLERLHVTLNMAFDEKWYWKVPRPPHFAKDKLDLDLANVVNAPFPMHNSFVAGHGTKFFTALEVLNDLYNIPADLYRNLFIIASVCSQGRSGSLIHYPMDNFCAGFLTTLKEFENLDKTKYDFLIS